MLRVSKKGCQFTDYILAMGGVVYGAGYEAHFRVVHKRAETKTQRDEFKGSKYVQSDLRGVFHQIRADLKTGRTVLFSGTPCQVAGLSSFLSKALHKRLYLIDIMCHGVPSPYAWRDYLSYLEAKTGKIITRVNFRDKENFGWDDHIETYILNDGSTLHETLFTRLFFKHVALRHSCRECKFAKTKRPGDITIADFWGWEKTAPDFNKDNKGCSLILCNTPKGEEFFKASNEQLNTVKVSLDDCMQPSMQHPTQIPQQARLKFEQDFATKGFIYAIKRQKLIGWRRKARDLYKKTRQVISRLTKQK